jgi:hypothetical protein
MSLTKGDIERWLADALERLYDYSYLGQHVLSHLRVVSRMTVHDETPLTHVDRGRALSKALLVALDELKPSGGPANVGRESRFYDILSLEYREGRENADVALSLAISERTFYRDRRRALHALAQVVWEMESQQP